MENNLKHMYDDWSILSSSSLESNEIEHDSNLHKKKRTNLGDSDRSDGDTNGEDQVVRRMTTAPPPNPQLPRSPDRSTLARALKETQGYDESVEKLLALELGQLSMKEREAAQFDLHGISDAIEETPELLADSLQNMRNDLEKIIQKEKENDLYKELSVKLSSAFLAAMEIDPIYAQSRKLWISMLRSVNYDPHQAASKLLNYFKTKLDIFGSKYLTKDITIRGNFTGKDRICLESGWIQVHPLPDRAGRTIVFVVPPLRPPDVDEQKRHAMMMCKLKTMYYVFERISQDETCQKQGCVFLIMNVGPRGYFQHPNQHRGVMAMNSLAQSLPLRFEGYHICSNTVNQKEFATMTVAKSSEWLRFRARQHYGSIDDLKLSLMSFGIPCNEEVFPIRGTTASDAPEFPLGNHLSWCQRQVQKENQQEPVSISVALQNEPGDIVEIPNASDVLFGRSANIKNNPGNQRYARYLDEMEARYNCLDDPLAKSKVSMEIVLQLKAEGSRFLKPVDGKWIVQTDVVARDKVSNAFRDRRKKRRDEGTKMRG